MSRGLAVANHLMAGQEGEARQPIDDVLIVIRDNDYHTMLNHEFT